MDKKEKKELSETDIKAKFITPAIQDAGCWMLDAGWDEMKQIRREVTLTPSPVIVRGNMSSRNKKKFADYVLQKEKGVPIAVVEAKDNKHSVRSGMQQALSYSDILEVPSTFSSNGDAFASHNKVPQPNNDIETEFSLGSFPSPNELWLRYKTFPGIEEEDEELIVDPSYEVYLGLYQALTGPDEEDKIFKNEMVGIVDRSSHGTCKLVSEKIWRKVVVIPPHTEQIRIVTKVDELIALCDQLKALLGNAQTTQLNLADAIVQQAVG